MNINRRIIICPRHWPPAYLRSWTEFNFAGKPAVVGDKNILCEHHLRMQSTPVGRFDLYIQLEWLKLLQFDFYSRKFVYVCDPSQMRRGPTGTDRRPLSVTTGDYVAGKSAGYENQENRKTKWPDRKFILSSALRGTLASHSRFLCTPLKFSWSLKKSLQRRTVTICR